MYISFSSLSADGIKCYQCSSTEDQRKPTGDWATDQYTRNRYGGNNLGNLTTPSFPNTKATDCFFFSFLPDKV